MPSLVVRLLAALQLPLLLYVAMWRLGEPELREAVALGAYGETWARLWALNVTDVRYRRAGDDDWLPAPPPASRSAKFGTSVVELVGLEPGAAYEVRAGAQTAVARTAPASRHAPASFSFGSCMTHTPLLPFAQLDWVPRDDDFFLLTGDGVYLDALGPWLRQDPGRAYRQWAADPHVAALARRVPLLQIYDDHEVANNWDGATDAALVASGVEAWDAFAGSRNPRRDGDGDGRWFTHEHGAAELFVLDTRWFRRDGQLLGAAQTAALHAWLLRESGRVKFVVSSVIVTRNRGSNHPLHPDLRGNDGWHQFPAERDALLDFIEAHALQKHVVFLSGDVHNAFVAELRPGLFEVCASPIHSVPLPGHYGPREDPLLWEGAGRQFMGRVSVSSGSGVLVQILGYSLWGREPEVEFEALLPVWPWGD